MKWLIVMITLNTPHPWAIPLLNFDTKEACVKYVNSKENIGTLAIEVIAKGGFNDRIEAIMCLPEGNDTVKRKYDG
jgi:hypothetical protein